MTEIEMIEDIHKDTDKILDKLEDDNMDNVGSGYAWNAIYDTARYGRNYDGAGVGLGTTIGNGMLGFQNMRINDNVEHGFCDANLDRAQKFTNGVILDNQYKMQADNKVDAQSAFLTSQHADLKSTINTDNLIIKNDITALASKLADCCCEQKVASKEINAKLDKIEAMNEKNLEIQALKNQVNTQILQADIRQFGGCRVAMECNCS